MFAEPAANVGPTEIAAQSDNALAEQAKAGDTRAFEALYRVHVDRVYAICLRMVADIGWAEELTQDTFVRAWRRLGGFRGESAFGTWLYRVAVNVVLAALRTERRRKARFVRAELHDVGCPAAPGEAMDLEKAIAALPRKARMVFVLHEIEGYRHDEIARAMHIAPGTSKAHLFRARKLLQQMLEQ